MAWIESHQSLRNHQKVLMAAELLVMDKHKLIGHLQCLWWWGLDNADIEGNLPIGTTAAVIAEGAEIPRKRAEKFVKILIFSGFLEKIPGEFPKFRLHDWYDYAGKLLERRKANRERVKSFRNAHVIVTSPLRNGATVPNRTQPEEEHKEESVTTEEPKEKTGLDLDFKEIVNSYEENCGLPITPAIADEIKAALNDHIPKAAVVEAIRRAALQGKRSWAYIAGILERWRMDGWGSVRKPAEKAWRPPVL